MSWAEVNVRIDSMIVGHVRPGTRYFWYRKIQILRYVDETSSNGLWHIIECAERPQNTVTRVERECKPNDLAGNR